MKINQDTAIGFTHFDPRYSFFWALVNHCATQEAERLGIRLTTQPATTTAEQTASIHSFLQQHVDALLITPVASKDPGLIEAVGAANAAGVPVITLDSDIGGGQVNCIVRSDNIKGQELITEYAFKRLGGQGKVAHLQGKLDVQVGALRSVGFHNVLGRYPGIQLIFEAEGDWHRETGATLARQALAAHPDLSAIIAGNDLTAIGANDALAEIGRTGQVIVTGFDALPEALLAIQAGSLTATIRQSAQGLACQSLEVALAALRGEPVPPVVFTEIELITVDNFLTAAVDGLHILAGVMRNLTESNEAQRRLQQQIIESQQQAILELSTPVIPLVQGVILMPLIGNIDTLRARDITRSLLAGISQQRARVVILDITGVSLVDSGVANHLNKAIQAARLKGARTIITGISDAVAETIVDLGIDWHNIETKSSLETGLLAAFNSLGVKLVRVENGR